MRALPFLAVALVLIEAGASAFLFLTGPWLLALALGLLAVMTVVVLVRARRAGAKPPATLGYVERERIGY